MREDFWLAVGLVGDLEERGGRRSLIRIALRSELDLLKRALRSAREDHTVLL